MQNGQLSESTPAGLPNESSFCKLERDFISARTKEALKARKDRGMKLGKSKGVIQASIYYKDKDKILELSKLGVSCKNISQTHLGYGTAICNEARFEVGDYSF